VYFPRENIMISLYLRFKGENFHIDTHTSYK